MDVKNKGLVFDSRRAPGSVLVKTDKADIVGFITVTHKPVNGPRVVRKKGDRFFIPMNHQDPRFKNVPVGTYEEVKAAVIKAF